MRIVIAEDSGLLRQMLAETLTRRGFDVVGQAADLTELLCLADSTAIDVVVLDIRMPPAQRDEGIQAAEEIRSQHPAVGLLVLSHYAETSYAVRLLEFADRGVGYLVKDRVQDSDRLVEAIQRVGSGEVVIDPDVVQQLIRRRRTANPVDRLTPSERRVLALVAEGRSNTAIAEELSYSAKTVEKRITSIVHKLDLPHIDDPDRPDVNLRVLAVLTYLRNVQPT
jgi:DNA-binding NarL/FixJ family response regulator